MGAGLRAHRHGGHAGQRLQPAGQLVHQLQRALHGGLGLHRVDVGKAGEARDLLVEARIVLHRARAEREEAEIDGIVFLTEAHIVAQGLGL